MRNLRAQLISILAGGIALFAISLIKANEIELPEIGDRSGATISPEQERDIGREFMRQLHNSVTIIDDPEIATYLQSLGYQLVANSDNRGQEFTFLLFKIPPSTLLPPQEDMLESIQSL